MSDSPPKSIFDRPNYFPPWAPRIWTGLLPKDLWSLLAENRFRIHPTRYPMTGLLSFWSLCNLGMSWIQYFRYEAAIQATKIEKPPIFIIGHWRSGTTLLHEVMSLDKSFAFPSNFDAFVPHHFLVSGFVVRPAIRLLMPGKRPMDDMSIQVDTPQEDDFALLLLGAPSHYRYLGFPHSEQRYDRYLDGANWTSAELEMLEKQLRYFLRAITYKYQKRLVLKSPPHTGRIGYLAEWFPGAKFVHISRDPREIVPSTMRLWKLIHEVHGFQKPRYTEQELFDYVNACQTTMYSGYRRDAVHLDKNQIAEVSFEQLTSEPSLTIKSIYTKLELSDGDNMAKSAKAYFEQKKNHKRNRYDFAGFNQSIETNWCNYMEQFGYQEKTSGVA